MTELQFQRRQFLRLLGFGAASCLALNIVEPAQIVWGQANTLDNLNELLEPIRSAQGETGLLLKPESFEALYRDWFGQNYALGWGLASRSWANGPALWHNGSNTYWYALIWVAPRPSHCWQQRTVSEPLKKA